MRTNLALRDVETNGVMEVARATVKATPKVFSFFSDNIYADKYVAIVRELAANAVDSHVMAGRPDHPIEIWLPTDLDPVFRVRDHGLGMSHSFMMNNFMAYSDASTKDGDNIAIGGFGIGSKSPFAYTDAFTIRSVYYGVVSVYSVFKDEEGIPAIALFAQQSTTERNGVEVSFPVQNGDGPQFEEAAFKTLRHFEPLPIIHNACKGQFQPLKYLSRGASWGMRDVAGDLNVIMGGILYPCSTLSLNYELRYDKRLEPLFSYGLDLRLPIGSCDIALSREALSYTDRTNAAIREGLESTVDEIAESFSTMFDDHPTLWDAKVALGVEIGVGSYRYGGISGRAKFLGDNAFYRGTKFDAYIQAPRLSYWEIETRSGRRASSSLNNAKWEEGELRLTPKLVELIIIDDLPQSPKSKVPSKVRNYINENCDRSGLIYVLRSGLKASTLLIDLLGNPPHVLTSSLPEPEAVARTRNARPNVRLFTYDGRLTESYGNDVITNLNPGPGSPYGSNGTAGYRKGVAEVAYADQPSSGILVEMSSFELPLELRNKVNSGLIAWNELHFANSSDVAKLKKTWRMFDDVFAKRLAQAISAYPDLSERLALYNNPTFEKYFKFIGQTGIDKVLSDRQKKSPFGKICDAYNTYVKPLTAEQRRLSRFVEPKLPKSINPEKLDAAVSKNLKDMIKLVGFRSDLNHLVLEFI